MRLSYLTRPSLTLRLLASALLLTALLAAALALAPSAAAHSPTGTLVLQTVSGGPIYVIQDATPAGTHPSLPRYLTTGIDPALSPDGQQVAFTRWNDTQHGAFGSLWIINIDGTDERVILNDVRQPKSPVWSPDGTQITLSMQEGGQLHRTPTCSKSPPTVPIEGDFEDVRIVLDDDGDIEFCYTQLPHPFWGLRLVDVATGTVQDLPRDLFSYAPSWDPAHDWHLVYDGEQGLVNLDLIQRTTWALTDDARDHTPAFSPDGRHIALSYWQHDHWEIHLLNADGSGRARLTETPLRVIVEQRINGKEPRAWNNVAPTWSPDGSHIAFLTDRTGQWEIWVMQADGANQRALFPPQTLHGLNLQYQHVDERAISWR